MSCSPLRICAGNDLTDYVLHVGERDARAVPGGLVIPVTVDDLAANGLLEDAHSQGCWERSVETLTARKDEVAGLAVASHERIKAYVLYVTRGMDPLAGALAEAGETEIVSLRSFVDDGGARLNQLLSRLRARGMRTLRFPKVHPARSRRSGWRRPVSARRRASPLRSEGAVRLTLLARQSLLDLRVQDGLDTSFKASPCARGKRSLAQQASEPAPANLERSSVFEE